MSGLHDILKRNDVSKRCFPMGSEGQESKRLLERRRFNFPYLLFPIASDRNDSTYPHGISESQQGRGISEEVPHARD